MIIGLTGSLAAGKGVISDFLKQKGFVYLSLSDELREVAKEKKIEVTRLNLQNLGNELRENMGKEVLAKLVADKINNQQYLDAIVDGIRNHNEVEYLKNNLKNFYLISVDALKENRFNRLVARNRESDPKTWEEFLKVDERDKGIGESESGQNVGKCMGMADFTLINDADFESVRLKVEELYEEIERKLPRPTWDEYFLEISKAVAKRATCSRGRSGCVIAKNKQILVTGYVGSPPGLPHCDEVGHLMKTIIHEDGSQSQHCMRTTHAEQNAIAQAAKLGIPLEGSIIYVRMTPCATCARMIITSGINRVVCENKYHAGKESEEMFKQAGVSLEFIDENVVQYKNQKA